MQPFGIWADTVAGEGAALARQLCLASGLVSEAEFDVCMVEGFQRTVGL